MEVNIKKEEPTSDENLEVMIQENTMERPKSHFRMVIYNFFNFLKTIALIVILALVIRIFLIQPYIVEGQSMEPAFSDRDYLITEKVSYRFGNPVRGEVIIFHPPDDMKTSYIKRVVGLPGETVSIQSGKVYINGQPINEPYLLTNEGTLVASGTQLSITLTGDQFFVLGDNRNHSRDSRELGPIPRQNIISHVWFRLYPFNEITTFPKVKYPNPV